MEMDPENYNRMIRDLLSMPQQPPLQLPQSPTQSIQEGCIPGAPYQQQPAQLPHSLAHSPQEEVQAASQDAPSHPQHIELPNSSTRSTQDEASPNTPSQQHQPASSFAEQQQLQEHLQAHVLREEYLQHARNVAKRQRQQQQLQQLQRLRDQQVSLRQVLQPPQPPQPRKRKQKRPPAVTASSSNLLQVPQMQHMHDAYLRQMQLVQTWLQQQQQQLLQPAAVNESGEGQSPVSLASTPTVLPQEHPLQSIAARPQSAPSQQEAARKRSSPFSIDDLMGNVASSSQPTSPSPKKIPPPPKQPSDSEDQSVPDSQTSPTSSCSADLLSASRAGEHSTSDHVCLKWVDNLKEEWKELKQELDTTVDALTEAVLQKTQEMDNEKQAWRKREKELEAELEKLKKSRCGPVATDQATSPSELMNQGV